MSYHQIFNSILITFFGANSPVSSSDLTENFKIIGGYNASIEDFPYQVSISWKFTNGGETFLCGGFIVSASYVITAAHCAKDRDPARVIMRAGTIWRSNGTIILIAAIIGHPDFNFKLPMDKDIAIIRTVKPLHFTKSISPIRLPVRQTPLEDNSVVTISGWGLVAMNQSGYEYLQAVDIPVVNFYDCWSVYKDLMTRNMWCAGNFTSGGVSPCSGDSGGAAVQNGVVYGIVSWSEDCALPRKPTVFADVAAPAIRDFIHAHTGL